MGTPPLPNGAPAPPKIKFLARLVVFAQSKAAKRDYKLAAAAATALVALLKSFKII